MKIFTNNLGGIKENTKPNRPKPKQAPDIINSSSSLLGGSGGDEYESVEYEPTDNKEPKRLAKLNLLLLLVLVTLEDETDGGLIDDWDFDWEEDIDCIDGWRDIDGEAIGVLGKEAAPPGKTEENVLLNSYNTF